MIATRIFLVSVGCDRFGCAGLEKYVELPAHSQMASSTVANSINRLTHSLTPQQIASAYDFVPRIRMGTTRRRDSPAIATARNIQRRGRRDILEHFRLPLPVAELPVIPVGLVAAHPRRSRDHLDLERAGALASGREILVYECLDVRASTFEAFIKSHRERQHERRGDYYW